MARKSMHEHLMEAWAKNPDAYKERQKKMEELLANADEEAYKKAQEEMEAFLEANPDFKERYYD